jgi:prepilin peptidase CpaA
MTSAMPLLLKVVLIVIALLAGFYDWRTRKIPNWLNLSGVILGLGLNCFLLQFHGLLSASLGLGLALLVYLPLYLVRGMGAGDVKLMAAIGSIAGPQIWLGIFLATALLGGLASLVLVFSQRRLVQTAANVGTIVSELAHARLPFHKDPALDMHSNKALGLPHGTLIAAGSLVFLSLGLAS